jgi:clan AA aspartic protease (TIGR02281 family)
MVFKKNYYLTFFFFTFINLTYAQKVIKMERINKTYQIPCKVNGIPMKFVFDTGASDVSISSTEANFLIKQGLLTKDDFLEKVQYKIANGDIVEGTKINLKSIEIDGIIIKNISASVIDSQNAPLLLGQSAIRKIGRFSISGNELILLDYSLETQPDLKPKIKLSNSINEDALRRFNLFLSNKSIIDDVKGHLIFNKYSNSLDYNSTTIIYENPTLEKDIYAKITVDFSIPLNNVNKVVEKILKREELVIMIFDIYLDKKVKFTTKSKEKGKWLDQNISERDKVSITPRKDLTNSDIEILQLTMRDIFNGVKFEIEQLK